MEWWSDGIGVLALVVLQYSNILFLEGTLTMEICFLGTGAPWPDPLRGSSAILVDVGSARILLDCGRACVQQMARRHSEAATITHSARTTGQYNEVADSAVLVLTSWRFGR